HTLKSLKIKGPVPVQAIVDGDNGVYLLKTLGVSLLLYLLGDQGPERGIFYQLLKLRVITFIQSNINLAPLRNKAEISKHKKSNEKQKAQIKTTAQGDENYQSVPKKEKKERKREERKNKTANKLSRSEENIQASSTAAILTSQLPIAPQNECLNYYRLSEKPLER
ncbi:hypothetical protein STEG23_022040, partial [Scotinomys teguina]